MQQVEDTDAHEATAEETDEKLPLLANRRPGGAIPDRLLRTAAVVVLDMVFVCLYFCDW